MIDIFTTTRTTMRVDEVMEALGVSRRTVYYWIEKKNVVANQQFASCRITVDSLRHHVLTHPYIADKAESVQSTRHSA